MPNRYSRPIIYLEIGEESQKKLKKCRSNYWLWRPGDCDRYSVGALWRWYSAHHQGPLHSFKPIHTSTGIRKGVMLEFSPDSPESHVGAGRRPPPGLSLIQLVGVSLRTHLSESSSPFSCHAGVLSEIMKPWVSLS